MMDTERNKFIDEIVQKYSYAYNWQDQFNVWKKTGYFCANDVTIKKNVGGTEIQMVFDVFSELRISVKTNDERQTEIFIREFMIGEPNYDGEWLLIAKDKYNIQNCFAYLEKTYLKKIEMILDS